MHTLPIPLPLSLPLRNNYRPPLNQSNDYDDDDVDDIVVLSTSKSTKSTRSVLPVIPSVPSSAASTITTSTTVHNATPTIVSSNKQPQQKSGIDNIVVIDVEAEDNQVELMRGNKRTPSINATTPQQRSLQHYGFLVANSVNQATPPPLEPAPPSFSFARPQDEKKLIAPLPNDLKRQELKQKNGINVQDNNNNDTKKRSREETVRSSGTATSWLNGMGTKIEEQDGFDKLDPEEHLQMSHVLKHERGYFAPVSSAAAQREKRLEYQRLKAQLTRAVNSNHCAYSLEDLSRARPVTSTSSIATPPLPSLPLPIESEKVKVELDSEWNRPRNTQVRRIQRTNTNTNNENNQQQQQGIKPVMAFGTLEYKSEPVMGSEDRGKFQEDKDHKNEDDVQEIVAGIRELDLEAVDSEKEVEIILDRASRLREQKRRLANTVKQESSGIGVEGDEKAQIKIKQEAIDVKPAVAEMNVWKRVERQAVKAHVSTDEVVGQRGAEELQEIIKLAEEHCYDWAAAQDEWVQKKLGASAARRRAIAGNTDASGIGIDIGIGARRQGKGRTRGRGKNAETLALEKILKSEFTACRMLIEKHAKQKRDAQRASNKQRTKHELEILGKMHRASNVDEAERVHITQLAASEPERLKMVEAIEREIKSAIASRSSSSSSSLAPSSYQPISNAPSPKINTQTPVLQTPPISIPTTGSFAMQNRLHALSQSFLPSTSRPKVQQQQQQQQQQNLAK